MEKAELIEKLNDFIEIIDDFKGLLAEETAALKENNIKKISQLYEHKAKLVKIYKSIFGFMAEHKAEIAELNSDVKAALKEASTDLDKALHANEIVLKARMQTSQMVLNSIVNIAKITNNSNATSYGAHGTYIPRASAYNALTVNQTL